jgi:hypothetical protein
MERRDPHALGGLADEPLDPLAHLGRGLVGEGDREDLARPRLAAVKEAGDAASEHARLARTCARDDEERLAPVFDRLALLRVEAVEQGVRWRAVGVEDEGHVAVNCRRRR